MLKRIRYFSFALCLFISCTQHDDDALSPENLQKLVTEANKNPVYSDSVFSYLYSVFSQYTGAGFISRFGYYSYATGFYLYAKKNYGQALRYSDSMIWLVSSRKDKTKVTKELALANISKADVLFALKRYNEAYRFYYFGKVAAEKSLDPCVYSEYSYRLAMVMYKKENFDKAAAYFKQSLTEAVYCETSFATFMRKQEVLDNIALCYYKQQNVDSALWYYDRALTYIKANEKQYTNHKNFFEVAKGVLYGNLAQVYVLANKPGAEDLFRQSITINSKPGNEINDALITQVHLAQLYMDKQVPDMHLGYQMLQQIKKGLDTIANSNVAIKWSYLMSRYYRATGNKAAAYDYLQQHDSLQRNQTVADKTFYETDAGEQIRILQGQYNIALLKKDNQLKQAYLIVAIILFLLVAAVLMLIIYSWRKSRKNILLLKRLNKEINENQRQQKLMLKALEKENAEKKHILHIVAHDLRNPVSAINILAGLIKDNYDSEEENREFIDLIQSACNDGMQLIQSIMQMADNAKENYDFQLLEVNSAIADSLQLVRLKAEEKNQRISVRQSDELHYINADADKINRVIINIVTNAIKFSPAEASIMLAVKSAKEDIIITVADTGIGIPDEFKYVLFDVFTEAKRAGTMGEKTFGLGLSICKQIVEAHQGAIWFESEVNKGTTFYIRLPKAMHFATGQATESMAFSTS